LHSQSIGEQNPEVNLSGGIIAKVDPSNPGIVHWYCSRLYPESNIEAQRINFILSRSLSPELVKSIVTDAALAIGEASHARNKSAVAIFFMPACYNAWCKAGITRMV
jgi:hypothetical protein